MTTILDMICVGDVVRLKSSNVPMTVNQVNKDGTVNCVWIWEGEMKTGVFAERALEK